MLSSAAICAKAATGSITLLPTNLSTSAKGTISLTKGLRVLSEPALHGMILAGVEPASYANPMCESRYGSAKLKVVYSN
jgi:hypothetical protein